VTVSLPRNAQLWLPGYLKTILTRRERPEHVWLMIGDHYEPLWSDGGAIAVTPETARGRVKAWRELWPRIAERHRDSDNRPAQYTFFYPEEEYRPEYLEPLAEMARQSIADVEIHLHHDADTESAFVSRMAGFIRNLSENHGLLRSIDGRPVFGFIHGNWALDNSLPGGLRCGLNNEITLLRDLGCYADFTLPSAPSPAQTRTVNRIYWAVDDPARPRSHEYGPAARVGGGRKGDLLMVQGPLGVRFGNGRWIPRLENGELAEWDPPDASRVAVWFRVAPQLGRHLFIKLYTHGAQEQNAKMLLNGGLDLLFDLVAARARAAGCRLHYATAWQVYRAIDSLCRGREPDVPGR